MVHLDPNSSLISLEWTEKKNIYVTNTVTAIDYRAKDLQNNQMNKNKQIETVGDNEIEACCRFNLNIGEKYAANFQENFGDTCQISTRTRLSFSPIQYGQNHNRWPQLASTSSMLSLTTAGRRQQNSGKHKLTKYYKNYFHKACKSNWALPIVFAVKWYGLVRFCTDFKSLDAVTIKNAYAYRKWMRLLGSQGAHILDTRRIYRIMTNIGWELAQEKTTFTSHHDLTNSWEYHWVLIARWSECNEWWTLYCQQFSIRSHLCTSRISSCF